MTKDDLIEFARETVEVSKHRKYKVRGKDILIKTPFLTTLHEKPKLYGKKGKKEGNVVFVQESVNTAIESYKGQSNVTVLNFASAKNPGGGFLSGSRAQEECLARTSNLYLSLRKFQQDFYEKNRKENNPLYTDAMIFSRNVTFFRHEDGEFMAEPILVNVITSPAVNAGVAKQLKINDSVIEDAMQQRIRYIIHLAAIERTDYLILGAFGCGVFQNDDKKVAKMFKQVLEVEKMKYCFKEVKFAIYDDMYKVDRFRKYYIN
jgi:uncharacterized protein (TIGR02452 family)